MTSNAIIYNWFYIGPGKKDGDADISVLLDHRPGPNKPEPKRLNVKDIKIHDPNVIINPKNIIHKMFENIDFKEGHRFAKYVEKNSEKEFEGGLLFIEFNTKKIHVGPRDFSTLDR